MFRRAVLISVVLEGLILPSAAFGAIQKQQWLGYFETYFLQSVCSETGPLRELAKIESQESCQNRVVESLQGCIQAANAVMPASLGVSAGEAWGQKLGQCTANHLQL